MTRVASPSRAGVDEMFDRIADRYDLANRVLSGGLDVLWRRRLVAQLPARDGLRVLDVATGTADLALALADDPRVAHVTGVDISAGMLARGREKVSAAGLDTQITLARGDAQMLDAVDGYGAFDIVTIAFGIRNVADVGRGLASMAGALAPGGTLLCLEFAEPDAPLLGDVYRAYRRHVLPRVGAAIAGNAAAYRYLDDTIATFPHGESFCELLRAAGLKDVSFATLTFGAVQLTWGRRA
jgi:demethylmenaquinone methyltransferase/2-methoxy-6-polyprenyl-1,4-benzoquinol methylase